MRLRPKNKPESIMPNISAHLRYIGISDIDVAALRRVRPLIEQHVDEFTPYFYRHLQAFQDTRAFLTDPAVLQRLLIAQRHYVLNMFDAKFDDSYYDLRCQIGHTHFQLGLDFKWYIGAYALYLDFFMPRIEDMLRGDPDAISLVRSAFQKVTVLDMSIVLEAYHKRDKQALAETNRQVLHQEKLATVGLLVSGLAHEIGNPLASIQAICDNLLNRDIDTHIAEKLNRVRSQVDRIVNIVGQLVNYARPASPIWKKVNLRRVLESALEIARLARSAKTVAVSMIVNAALPPIEAIEDQLAQVFVNLFLNAFDAMPEEGGQLEISAAIETGLATIRVKDNGCGIPAANLKKIYEPFFSTKDVGKGTGLGLHVSLSIIQNHSGSIDATSALPCGTCFTIKLPVLQKASDEIPA